MHIQLYVYIAFLRGLVNDVCGIVGLVRFENKEKSENIYLMSGLNIEIKIIRGEFRVKHCSTPMTTQ